MTTASRFYSFQLTAFFFVCLSPFGFADENVQFNRDIRPILADNCFQCHGPDRSAREADLRLDLEEEVFANRETPAVVRGQSGQSELFARLVSEDPDSRMPPADSKKQLTGQQIELIRKWIDQGAKWEKHWAFELPVRVEPDVESEWGTNTIDQYVLAGMNRAGLRPSPPADKRTLIRRVSFDLTGLPPTPAEIQSFLLDDAPGSYERVVDRLLASPHYGERMAQDWLDAARYADSHGYSLDRRRVMWPWRDWVIDAYNRNMPFDAFATEQLAGDLLPNATLQQRLATGFNRNHPIQSEGGVINEEYRIETVVDRVETTSAVFLGLTMGCGRCHDHKYEPITQSEFYQFFAFFNNVAETAHVGNADNQADRPFIQTATQRINTEWNRLSGEIDRLREISSKDQAKTSPQVEQVWIDDQLPPGAKPFGNGGGPQSFLFGQKSAEHPVFSGTKSSVRESPELGQHGFTDAQNPVVIREDDQLFTYLYIDPKNPPGEIMLQWNSGGSWEHRAYWGKDLIAWGKENTVSRRWIGPMPEAGKWVRLEVNANKVGLVGKAVSGWAFTQFGGKVFWDKGGFVTREPSASEKRLAELQRQLDLLNKQRPTVMVMDEMDPPRATFVLRRGQYDAPTDERVTPGIPKVLGVLPEDAKPDRLALARWMFSRQNPLTARVTVNRYWQKYFGAGLVRSSEDFGTQGTPPTHPRLLDWLALRFQESNWDIKSLQKEIVMSATYRQSSKVTGERYQQDPANRWLSRAPRFRLSAEAIRDQALAISGLLVAEVGGPSVRPYQPPGLWKDVVYSNVPKFKQDHGAKLYRRSLYTYWKRSVPPPNLQTLDAPSREACTLNRSRTNTPQSVLVLWNDPTFVEAARKLAEKVAARKLNSDDSLSILFETTTSRPPDDFELNQLRKTYEFFVKEYTENPDAAKKLLSIGESGRRAELDTVVLAAYSAVANGLFGLDEVISKN